MTENEDKRRELPDMPEGFTRSGDDTGVCCDDVPCGLCERIIHLPFDDWIRNDRTCAYYCFYNECAGQMLLREGESDMLDKEENESPIPHKVNCEHCGKEIILESDDWMHNDRTGAYACDSAECTKAALQGSERTSSVSSYCPRCETQAELIAAKDEEIAELKKVNEDLRDRKDCICSPLISKDHRIEALTDERDKLRDAVESQNDWLERLVVLLDKHHNELIVPIKSRIHICKSALDSAAKGECEECERLRKGINEVRLDILNGEGARETTKKLHALGEKGDPR